MKLTPNDVEKLIELQDEIQADIEMLEEYYESIEQLLKKDEIHLEDLLLDVRKVFVERLN